MRLGDVDGLLSKRNAKKLPIKQLDAVPAHADMGTQAQHHLQIMQLTRMARFVPLTGS